MVVIGMNTLISAARRAEEGIENAGAQHNEVPQLEEVAMGDQVPFAPPPMADGDIREAFIRMSHVITTHVKAFTTEAQAMMDQANREVVPQEN